ncbi:hypothetical protein [Thalassococcus sp. S3]|uniref:hypothetical protein n=1 Tax=Thalassococcus sp. S3 TaxID=2017482 RepID=UPI00102439B2|nr:hypothetical protein [Thalassococcus sp. S3]QBF32804.1 hypothetical protein CFI11_16495 [Thalassococcus sp. S3]
MKKHIVAFAAALSVSACGGSSNPFSDDTETDPTDPDTGTPIESDRELPPGTASPSPNRSLFRSEPEGTDAASQGNGAATAVAYNSGDDTFSVDGLGFDGDNVYARGTNVGSLGPYAVYEAPRQFPDSSSGTPINQFTHRAIYGISTSRNTQFAIVRTGAYVPYGFGGFVYQRENAVTLPTTGQALYRGVMSGLRDFDGAGGLEYTTANIDIAIDFDDFNDSTGQRGDAVRGVISNRTIFDIDGNDITDNVISRIEADNNITLNQYPVATFTVGPGVLDDNGEILGSVQSYYTDSNGRTAVFEEGNYYAIVAGDNAEEIVGVVVLETTLDPVANSVRETGGFIVYR